MLKRKIGRGSFGEVWLAADNYIGVDVAIKIYVALDSNGLEEFKNEFRNVCRLNHPNLLRPDFFDHQNDCPYLVMAYCPGVVGRKVGQMSEQEIWKLIRDVSAGLAYLHERDILHRDIKPDNILISEQGEYVISDFGLSHRMRSTLRRASSRYNGSDRVSGTIGYMAPEMFTGQPNAVKATDIWALGATIYEAITGELPFCGQGGVMELHGAQLPVLPSGYSAELSDLVRRCLAKETWDRPTAIEINDVACHFRENEQKPSPAKPATPPNPNQPSGAEDNTWKDIIVWIVAILFTGGAFFGSLKLSHVLFADEHWFTCFGKFVSIGLACTMGYIAWWISSLIAENITD